MLKPNISTMVGGLYKKGDARRDGGFTIFYMGINIGAMLSSLLVGYIGEEYGWHYGFGLAGFGILIGIVTFLLGKKHLGAVGAKPQKSNVINADGSKGGTPSQRLSFTQEEKDRLIVLFICFTVVFSFFVAFEQAGGLMNLYADKYTNRYVLGWEVPASTLQALNPAFIMLFGPIVSIIWMGLSKRYPHISSIYKMGVGNIITGLSFLFMVGAALQMQCSPVAQSGLYWIAGAYFLQTMGELCLSPVSLSFITKVAPKRVKSSMMGIFFAVIGMANWAAAKVGAQSALLGDLTIFQLLFVITVLLGIPFIIFNKRLMKLTHGSEQIIQEEA
jgi:POT family proton-dependent oligopeptide transporter